MTIYHLNTIVENGKVIGHRIGFDRKTIVKMFKMKEIKTGN